MIGKTKVADYKTRVDRGFPLGQQQLWDFILSAEANGFITGNDTCGVSASVGDWCEGEIVSYRVTTLVEGKELRMKWKRALWPDFTTVILKVMAKAKGQSTIEIAHEGLFDQVMTIQMKEYWEDALKKLEILAIAAQYDF